MNFNQLSLQPMTNNVYPDCIAFQISFTKWKKRGKLTKRLELPFLDVFALPNASSIRLLWSILCSILELPPLRVAKYCIAIFAVSVFPAPLSPLKGGKNINLYSKLLYGQVMTYEIENREIAAQYSKIGAEGQCL